LEPANGRIAKSWSSRARIAREIPSTMSGQVRSLSPPAGVRLFSYDRAGAGRRSLIAGFKVEPCCPYGFRRLPGPTGGLVLRPPSLHLCALCRTSHSPPPTPPGGTVPPSCA
jgi:hypothetical protein